jgi:hypothetical protein
MDFDAAVSRIRQLLKDEIGKLPGPDRGRAVAVLHEELASRFAFYL